jgi:hypothetical protein
MVTSFALMALVPALDTTRLDHEFHRPIAPG